MAEKKESAAPAEETAAESGAEAPADPVAALTAERDKYYTNWIRAEAEIENLKKRHARDREEYRKYMLESVLKEFLVPIDYLEMAVRHARTTKNADALIQGVEYTHKCLLDVLKGCGVEQVSPKDGLFDPAFHEAQEIREAADRPEGAILDEHRKAYTMHGRLLRAGIVTVARKPAPKDEEKREHKKKNSGQEKKEE